MVPRFHDCVLVAMLVSAVTTSGCSTLTTLGYVPHLKPSDTTTYIPTYSEVKGWAYDVADGYDSRAIINRRSGYAGAILAAAAVGAIVGLGAFDPGNPAITGIPIGTTFLSTVAVYFSDEQKARIYDLGSEGIKDLITLSDERLAKRRVSSNRTEAALNEVKDALTKAEKQLSKAEQHQETQKHAAEEVHRKLKEIQDELTKTRDKQLKKGDERPVKIDLSKVTEAADRLVLEAKEGVVRAQLARNAAQDRRDEAFGRNEAWKALLSARSELAQARGNAATTEAQLKVEAAEAVWNQVADALAAEALCLRMDINNVMRKVEELKAKLVHINAAVQLKAVEEAAKKVKQAPSDKGTANKASPSDKKAETAETKFTPEDLRDLMPPVKSVCENAI